MKKKMERQVSHTFSLFSHSQSNSCRIAVDFIGNASFEVSKKKQDKSGRILILDVKVSDSDFLLSNL